MNCLMAGMMPVAAIAFAAMRGSHDPSQPLFWFRMSLALMFGTVIAYPMNWWLVAYHRAWDDDRPSERSEHHTGDGGEDGNGIVERIGDPVAVPTGLGDGRNLVRGAWHRRQYRADLRWRPLAPHLSGDALRWMPYHTEYALRPDCRVLGPYASVGPSDHLQQRVYCPYVTDPGDCSC